eukprot:365747-Chlamydomonas_euryale.AAC.23
MGPFALGCSMPGCAQAQCGGPAVGRRCNASALRPNMRGAASTRHDHRARRRSPKYQCGGRARGGRTAAPRRRTNCAPIAAFHSAEARIAGAPSSRLGAPRPGAGPGRGPWPTAHMLPGSHAWSTTE